MYLLIDRSRMWLSFLKVLERNRTITRFERFFLLNEFKNNNLLLTNLDPVGKGTLLGLIETKRLETLENLNRHIRNLQNITLIKRKVPSLTRTWLSVDAYATKNNRPIIAFIHALISIYIKV